MVHSGSVRKLLNQSRLPAEGNLNFHVGYLEPYLDTSLMRTMCDNKGVTLPSFTFQSCICETMELNGETDKVP